MNMCQLKIILPAGLYLQEDLPKGMTKISSTLSTCDGATKAGKLISKQKVGIQKTEAPEVVILGCLYF